MQQLKELICSNCNTDKLRQNSNILISTVESVIKQVLSLNADVTIIIKSTVPVGFTNKQRSQTQNIIFSPEFLREGQGLNDSLNPMNYVEENLC